MCVFSNKNVKDKCQSKNIKVEDFFPTKLVVDFELSVEEKLLQVNV